jgi:cytochrome c oxidase subunit 1
MKVKLMGIDQETAPEEIHLPAPSYQPAVLAFGVALLAIGVLWTPVVGGIGLVVILVAIAGWTQENRRAGHEEARGDENGATGAD